MKNRPIIGLVDDEPELLRALDRLLSEEGFEVHTHNSADDLIRADNVEIFDCLILDVSMPGLNGLDLQAHLRSTGIMVPIIFLTGTGDIPSSVRAIKAGAINFLTKPFASGDLLAAIDDGLALNARLKAEEFNISSEQAKLDMLTPREHEVLREVISGKLNKQIAYNLGISEQTVKVHRMHLNKKMAVTSVAELVRITEHLGILPSED